MKLIDVKKNCTGGYDLFIGNNPHDVMVISTGKAELSEEFWIALMNEASNVVDCFKAEREVKLAHGKGGAA